MIFKREVLEKMKGIEDAPFMHDHLALVLSAGLGEIRLTWETLVNYRQHARNVIGTRASTAFNESEFLHQLARRLDFFEKHWGQEDWFDYEAVRKFYRRYVQRGTWIGNFSDIKFFQAMQPDGLKYRLLGAVKCIFPRFFYWLKANLRRESGV